MEDSSAVAYKAQRNASNILVMSLPYSMKEIFIHSVFLSITLAESQVPPPDLRQSSSPFLEGGGFIRFGTGVCGISIVITIRIATCPIGTSQCLLVHYLGRVSSSFCRSMKLFITSFGAPMIHLPQPLMHRGT